MSRTFLESLENMKRLEAELASAKEETRLALLKHWTIEPGVTRVVDDEGVEWLAKDLGSQYYGLVDAHKPPWLKGVRRGKKGWSQKLPQTIYRWKVAHENRS